MKTILLFTFLFVSLLLGAQSIDGNVNDIESNAKMSGATVQLIGQRSFSTTSNDKGRFQLSGIPVGKYQLRVSYVGYETHLQEVVLETPATLSVDVELLIEKSALDEVTIEGKTPLATVNGDTTEYNADAYTTHPDADAEDLIKKMPGIIVDDGTVSAQGENVNKVYVDGKPFFDQDPTLALRSLPADVIQKIEVFDEQSEQSKFTGFDDGETSKVMNIVTRKNMRNGQFGKLFGAIGYPDKYHVGANVNVFDGDKRISVIAQSNNVNQQNFSNEDLMGVLSSGGRRGGGFRGAGGGGGGGRKGGGGRPKGGGGSKGKGGQGASKQDFMVGNQSGITTSSALGINYSDMWGEKIKVSSSYFFNMSDNESLQDVNQEYFTEFDTLSQSYVENNETYNQNFNHRFHFKMDYNINDNNRLIVQPRLSFQSNSSTSDIVGDSWVNGENINRNVSSYLDEGSAYNFSNRMTWMHKFSTEGRTISFSVNNSFSENVSESTQTSERVDIVTELLTDSLNQYTDFLKGNKRVSSRVMYTEAIGEHSQLMLNAATSVSYGDNDREVFNYDYAQGDYITPDSVLSNVYESEYATQQLGASFMRRWDKNMLMFKVDYERANLSSNQLFPEANNLKRTYHSVLPMVRFKYDITDEKSVNFFYRTNTSSPSVTQLQNTIDNSNPLQLSVGNPDLNPTFDHNVSLRYNTSNASKASLFFIMASLNYTQNYIGNNTWYAMKDTLINGTVLLQQGGQFTQTANMDDAYSLRCFSTYGVPLSFIKSNFNVNLGYNYSFTPGVYNDVKTSSTNHVLSTGFVVASNISENVDFTLSSNTSYNSATSTLQTESNDYIKQKTELSLNLIFPHGIVFRSGVASQLFYWTASDTKDSYVMLNMELGKKFLKKQELEVKLSMYDVLNQNTNYSRSVTDIYVEDVRSNVLQRYVMLSVNYRLRNFRM